MKAIGICFGATTMQCVELSGNGQQIAVDRTVRIPHEGTPRKAFLEYLKLTDNPVTIDRIAVTGRAFRNCVTLSSISEPEAMELSLHRVYDEKEFTRCRYQFGR